MNSKKPMSIPALELHAALSCLKMVEFLSKAINVPLVQFRFWSDSKCLHHWLETPADTLQRGVRNSIAYLQTHTDLDQWFFVPTDKNPADIASRGSSVEKLKHHDSWWNGPLFLVGHEDYPPQFSPKKTQPTFMTKYALPSQIQTLEDSSVINHFGSWTRLVNFAAICLRWKTNAIAKKKRDQSDHHPQRSL